MIDFASTSALRSQTLWHAIASGVSQGNSPTLSFVRPSDPYVSIGYHRRLDELDQVRCSAMGLPIYRRMVGGGPVYLDSNQLFFQITVPMSMVPPVRSDAFTKLLAPSTAAFRAAGLDAHMDASHEIVVGDRKICGHGAGQIEDAAVVVGNCIERFDHVAATSILALPDEDFRHDVLSCMERFVGVPGAAVNAAAFKKAAVDSYASSFDMEPEEGKLDEIEVQRLQEMDRLMLDPKWSEGPLSSAKPKARQIKIRAGVYVIRAAKNNANATLTVVNGRLSGARFVEADLGRNTTSLEDLEDAVIGLTLTDAQLVLGRSGEAGMEFANAIRTVDQSALEAGQ